MKTTRSISCLLAAVVMSLFGSAQPRVRAAATLTTQPMPSRPSATLSIAGEWRFQMDANDVGLKEKWFAQELPNLLRLPGSLQAQGYGNEISPRTEWTGEIQDRAYFTDARYERFRQPGNVKVPFWLTPWKHYLGAVWYHREVVIPPDWKSKHIVLSLERCHWETALWVDGQPVGSGDSLSTPHAYDLSRQLTPGPHRLTLRVDNRVRIPVGLNSHSVSDHTQGNWNGIVGSITLTAGSPLYIEDVQLYPQLGNRSVRVALSLANTTPRSIPVNLFLRASSTNLLTRHAVPIFNARSELVPGHSTLEVMYPLGQDMLTWDEFSPALYDLDITLESRSDLWDHGDSRRTTFGMREVAIDGTQFTINGRRTFLRGTLECAIFPITGYPPTDVEAWKRIIRICKTHGLNHIRFHSWCPPKAAFSAADELGFYYQIECASWPNGDSSLGDGKPIDRWISLEAERILKEYGNHPSFLLLASGNEPGGRNQKEFLGKLVQSWKTKDPRRLYTSASGWPLISENDYHSSPEPRIQAWGQELSSRINARPPETVSDYRAFVAQHNIPVVSHELGQWTSYPNLGEISKYTGFYSPGNFEIFRHHLQSNGMEDQAGDFLRASGKLQALCYKEDIESALRTPGLGGFQLLDLHDFPGQGTAPVGVLDAFWDSKGYITASEYRRFCSSSVPLARLAKRVWTSDETLTADLELAHFGPDPLPETPAYWKLVDDRGQIRASGSLEPREYPLGNGLSIGKISQPLGEFQQAERLKLVVGLGEIPGQTGGKVSRTVSRALRWAGFEQESIENDWDVWVFPPQLDLSPGTNVLVTARLGAEEFAHLDAGGDLLLMPPPASITGDVKLGFSPIFWNTAWTRDQAPHTLGILCNPQHPALQGFPTDFHSNWQWWDLISTGAATVMDDLPGSLRPIVQVVDDWYKNRKLGFVFEARLAKGRVLFCSLDLRTKLEERPVARQLLHSLLRYMDGLAFAPNQELTPDHLARLLKN